MMSANRRSPGRQLGLQSRFFVSAAFTLCKENLETLEAISYMAAALGVLPSDFTYAGIKDKRAVTYQSMVVKKVSPQRYFWDSDAIFHCWTDVEL